MYLLAAVQVHACMTSAGLNTANVALILFVLTTRFADAWSITKYNLLILRHEVFINLSLNIAKFPFSCQQIR